MLASEVFKSVVTERPRGYGSMDELPVGCSYSSRDNVPDAPYDYCFCETLTDGISILQRVTSVFDASQFKMRIKHQGVWRGYETFKSL